MANGKQLNVNLSFNADTSKAKRQLEDLQKQLNQIVNQGATTKRAGYENITKELQEASQAAASLQAHLQQATNVNTGKLDLGLLNESFKKAGTSLEQYRTSLLKIGSTGEQAFNSLASSILKAEVPLKKTNTMLHEFGTTLKNTAKWQISSSILHGFMGSVQSAYYYAQNLNESLNNIRIVTGQNTEQMAQFASEANKAAKALSTTTTDYTNASLIYYQQGLSDAEVKERTDVTVKMANVARESADIVSQQMTSVWNNFNKEGDESAEHFADVMTALGAATASSTDEIAEGLEKFSAVADTVGLSFDYATAALATVTAQTRQSANIVGNAFKTIFARMESLKLGENLEDGTDLNKYSQVLANIGINIKDQNGELRQMDDILDDIGAKWQTLSKDQQVATAQTVAGVRQYSQFVALFDNWDFFEKNLETARNSEGTLQEQADIYEESWEAAQNRVRASFEGLWQEMLDDKAFINLDNAISKIVDSVGNLVKAMGGFSGILSSLGAVALKLWGKDIGGAIDRFIYNLADKQKIATEIRQQAISAMQEMAKDPVVGEAYGRLVEVQQAYIDNAENMNEVEKSTAQILLDQQETRTKNLVTLTKERQEAEKILQKETQNAISKARIGGADKAKQGEINSLIKELEQVREVSLQTETALENAFLVMDRPITGVEKLEQIKQAFKDISMEGHNVPEAVTKALETIKTSTQGTPEELERVSEALSDLWGAATSSGEAYSIDTQALEQLELSLMDVIDDEELLAEVMENVTNAAIGYAESTTTVTKATKEVGKAAEETSKAYQKMGKHPETAGQKIAKVAGSLTSVLMAVNSLKGALDTLQDDDLSFFDKFMSVTMSLSMSISMLASGMPAVMTALRGLGTQLGIVTAEATAADAALAPILLVIGAIAAAVGIAVVAFDQYNKAMNASTIHAQKMAEEAENLKTRFQELKTAADEFKKSVSDYDNGIKALEDLDSSTEEYKETLEKTNEQARKLIETHKLFGKYKVENGLIKINPDALKEVQNKQDADVRRVGTSASMQEIITNNAKTADQLQEVIKELKKPYFQDDNKIDMVSSIRADEIKQAANALYDLKESTEETSLTQGEWEELIRANANSLPSVITKNVSAISRNADALVKYQDSVNKATEANRYYTEEILGFKIEEVSGDALKRAATNKGGEVDLERYEMYKAADAKKAVDEGEKNLEEAAEQIDKISKEIDRRIVPQKNSDIWDQLKFDYDLGDTEAVYKKWAELQGYDSTSVSKTNPLNYILGKGTYDVVVDGKNKTESSNDAQIAAEVLKALKREDIQSEATKIDKGESDDFINNLDSIVDRLDALNSKYGVDVGGAFGNNFGSGFDIKKNGFDFSSIFPYLSENAKNDLKDSLLSLKDDADLQKLFPEMFEEGEEATKENFEKKINEAFSKYDSSAYKEKVKDITAELSGSMGDIGQQLATGDITAFNAGENEDFQKMLTQINQLKDEYPELTSAVGVLNQKWLIGTQEYTEALEKVQDKIYNMNLSNLQEQAQEASDKFKDLFETNEEGVVIKIKADTDEFESVLDEYLNAQYEVDVAIHAEGEQEFNSLNTAFAQMEEMASKIGDNFVVAASDIRELNNVFPGIIENIKYLNDGTAKLSEESVQRAMESAEAEAQADAQVTVQKLQNQAALLRAKQKVYQDMANAALQLAKNETDSATASTTARETLSNGLAELERLNSQDTANSEMTNQKEVTDSSHENASQLATNWASAFQSMAESAFQAAQSAIANMNAVVSASKGEGGAATAAPKIASQYSGSTGIASEASITNGVQKALEAPASKAQEQFAELAQSLQGLADAAGKSANDLEGAAAQIGASASSLDKKLGGVSKGLGADGKKGKGGGGGKEDKPDQKDLIKDELDRYFDINNAIAQINDQLTKNEALQKRLSTMQSHYFGEALIKSLEEENKLLENRNKLIEKQTANYEQMYAMQKSELADLKEKIGGVWSGDELQNYSELFRKNVEAYNAVIAQYNAMTKAQQEAMGKQMVEQAKQTYELYKSYLERYQKLYYNEMMNTENKIAELRQQQLENKLKMIANNLKKWETKIKIKLDKTKLKRDWNDFLKEVKQDFRKVFKDLVLDSSFNKKNFDELLKDFETRKKQIEDVEKEIDKLNKKGKAGKNNKFATKEEAQEYLKKLKEEMENLGKQLQELYKQVWDNYMEGLEQAAQGFEDINNEFEHLNKNLEYEKELIELIYGDKAYGLMSKYYETQKRSLKDQIDSTRKQESFWKEQFEKAYEMNKDKHNVDKNDPTTWTEDMKKAYEELYKCQDKLNDLVTQYMKNLRDEYLNHVAQAIEEAQKKMYGGKTLSEMKKEYDFAKKKSDLLLDDAEKAYELTKLSNQINESIRKNSKDSKAQQKLAELRDSEIKSLREKESLTKYDIQLAEQRYQIALKEIEVENAQDAKNSMKLTRNENGDWTYQYVADETEVETKKQELLDLINEYRTTSQEAKEAMTDFMYDTWEEYWEKYEEIANDTTLREQEKLEKLQALNEEYWPLIEEVGGLAQRYQQEEMVATSALFAEVCEQDASAYANLTEYQKEMVDGLRDHHLSNFEEIRTALVGDYNDIKDVGTEDLKQLRKDAQNCYDETSKTSHTAMEQIIKDWDQENKDSVKGAMQDVFKEIIKLTGDFDKELVELEKISGKNIMDPGGVVDDLDHIGQKSDEVGKRTDDLAKKASGNLDQLRDFVNQVEEAWDKVIGKIEDAIKKLQDYIDKMKEAKQESNSSGSGGGSGSGGSGGGGNSGGGGSNGGGGSSGGNSGKNPGKGGDSERWSITGHGAEEYTANLYKAVVEITSTKGNQKSIKYAIAKNKSNGVRNTLSDLDKSFRNVYRKQYPGLKTGGYTGEWANGDTDGRLAFLHQKELVLNSHDTNNMLNMVNTVRDLTGLNGSINQVITDGISNMVANLLAKNKIGNFNVGGNSNKVPSNVFNVTAEFPNANDVNTIKEAILSLPNIVSQYIQER